MAMDVDFASEGDDGMISEEPPSKKKASRKAPIKAPTKQVVGKGKGKKAVILVCCSFEVGYALTHP
jgi:hypothetical protein